MDNFGPFPNQKTDLGQNYVKPGFEVRRLTLIQSSSRNNRETSSTFKMDVRIGFFSTTFNLTFFFNLYFGDGTIKD